MRRREDARILRGQARYVDDIELPRMAHVAFVRSLHASARLLALRAPAHAPGLIGVWTAADLRPRLRPFWIPTPDDAELAPAAHPILADGKVRYVGQPIAAVVAESRALAEDFAELVEVEYEPLGAVVSAREAPEALLRWERAAGPVDEAFSSAAHVVRGSYALPRTVSAPIECRGAVCDYDAGSDLVTVWCSMQDPHRPLAQLAQILDRPDDRIRVIVGDVGGAFGSKGAIAPELAAVARAAIELGRPLKWAEDRLENFLAAYQGRGMEADMELALDADGLILGVRARLWADLGAYLYPSTPTPPHTAAMLMTGCYDIPAADVRLIGARTHKVPAGPSRGAGRPEAAYFLESVLDEAARELGRDPVALRQRNLVRVFPHRSPLGWTYDSGDYERCLELAEELLEAQPSDRGRAAGVDSTHVRGTGFACYVERSGGRWESADVTVEPSGRVVVRSSSSPHGQGHDTTFAQIAAERLGLELDDIVLRFGDSAIVPRGTGTFASRSAAMGGSALVTALDKIVAKVRGIAAHLLSVAPDELTWDGAELRADDGRSVSFAQVAAAAYQPPSLPPGLELGLEASGRFSSDLTFSSGVCGAIVEIERETGRVRIVRIAAVDDAGTLINPLLTHGQIVGGIVHALGECLVEEVVHDEAGQMRSASFMDYSLLTAAEIPELRIGELQTPSPLNPLGAKGAGEGGSIGALPAVANAIADALGGIRVSPPYDAETLWLALQGDTR